MTTIASEIERIQDAKADLKSSLNAKNDANHQITTQKISQYSNYADNIYVEPEEAEEKDINFYDYDGFRLASWTLSELSSKTALPENLRKHDGLVFETWNWTLAQLKTNNQKTTVGALYGTEDGSTKLYLDITRASTSISLNLNVTSGTSFKIDWGQGGTPSSYTGSGSAKKYSHTYNSPGKYVISISIPTPTSSDVLAFCGNNPTIGTKSNMFGTLTTDNYNLFNTLTRVELSSRFNHGLNSCAFNRFYNLRYFISSSKTDNPGAYTFYDCEGLKAINLSQGVISIGAYCFSSNQALEHVSLPYTCTNLKTEAFRKCYVLRDLTIPKTCTTLGGYALASCNCVKYITISSGTTTIPTYSFAYTYGISSYEIPSTVTSIAAQAFLNCYGLKEIHFKRSTPPTVDNANAFDGLPTTCRIYVPSAYLSTYRSATNYPSSSSYTYIGE